MVNAGNKYFSTQTMDGTDRNHSYNLCRESEYLCDSCLRIFFWIGLSVTQTRKMKIVATPPDDPSKK